MEDDLFFFLNLNDDLKKDYKTYYRVEGFILFAVSKGFLSLTCP
jgi:hypothetical protein